MKFRTPLALCLFFLVGFFFLGLSATRAADVSSELANDYSDAVNRKDKDARGRLEKRAQSGLSEAQVRFGMLLQKEESFPQAVTWFQRAAQQGNVDGMRGLGICYRDGQGVAEDATQAMKWLRKASNQGDGDADSDIGGLYLKGRGVPKDNAVAVSWFRKGAAKGSSFAMSDLAACYWAGIGVEKSAREAANWWKQAVEKGDDSAKENLKMALEEVEKSGQPPPQSAETHPPSGNAKGTELFALQEPENLIGRWENTDPSGNLTMSFSEKGEFEQAMEGDGKRNVVKASYAAEIRSGRLVVTLTDGNEKVYYGFVLTSKDRAVSQRLKSPDDQIDPDKKATILNRVQ